MLAPMWEEAGGAREEELLLLKGEWEAITITITITIKDNNNNKR